MLKTQVCKALLLPMLRINLVIERINTVRLKDKDGNPFGYMSPRNKTTGRLTSWSNRTLNRIYEEAHPSDQDSTVE